MTDFYPGYKANGKRRAWTDLLPSRLRKQFVEFLRKQDGDMCAICGDIMHFDGDPNSPAFRSLDHIQRPKTRKMAISIKNMRLTHRWCNSARQDYDD